MNFEVIIITLKVNSMLSVSGLFVRRMVLAFEQQSFSQVTRLHRLSQTFFKGWSPEDIGDGRWDDDSQIGDASLSIIDIMGHLDEHRKSNIPQCVFSLIMYSVIHLA